jgi:hypothetical protein
MRTAVAILVLVVMAAVCQARRITVTSCENTSCTRGCNIYDFYSGACNPDPSTGNYFTLTCRESSITRRSYGNSDCSGTIVNEWSRSLNQCVENPEFTGVYSTFVCS